MNILLLGYGSIGARHGLILESLGSQVTVVSGNSACPYKRFTDLRTALDHREYDGVVVATPTSRHLEALQGLAEAGFSGRILVEKPLFDHPAEIPPGLTAQVSAAYNLRWHPLLQRTKELLADRPIYSLHAYVGQYLPQWRPGRDYRNTYSAFKEQGGGALRDLSHELDYLQWLTGTWQSVVAWGGRVSQLEISSDDLFGLMLKTGRCPLALIQLNYLDLTPGGRREFIINAENLNIHGSFNGGFLCINGEKSEVNQPERNHTYSKQLQAWLAGANHQLCDAREALETVLVVEAAERSVVERRWIDR